LKETKVGARRKGPRGGTDRECAHSLNRRRRIMGTGGNKKKSREESKGSEPEKAAEKWVKNLQQHKTFPARSKGNPGQNKFLSRGKGSLDRQRSTKTRSLKTPMTGLLNTTANDGHPDKKAEGAKRIASGIASKSPRSPDRKENKGSPAIVALRKSTPKKERSRIIPASPGDKVRFTKQRKST